MGTGLVVGCSGEAWWRDFGGELEMNGDGKVREVRWQRTSERG